METPKQAAKGELPPIPTLRNLRGYFILPELARQGMVQRLGRGLIWEVLALGDALVLVVAGGGAGLYDLRQGEALWEIDCPTRYGTLSPNEQFLALAGAYGLHLWDVSRGQLLLTLTDREDEAGNLAFSPDGQILAVGMSDKKIQLWQISDGVRLHSIGEHTNSVGALAFTPDGQMLAAVDYNKIRLWRVSDGTQVCTFTGHGEHGSSVTFAPDGQTLLSGADATRLWRVSDGTLLSIFGATDGVGTIAFTRDGQRLAAGAWDNCVRIWRVGDGVPPGMITEENEIYAPEGQEVVYNADGEVTWRLTQNTAWHTLTIPTPANPRVYFPLKSVWSVAFTPDGQYLASGSEDGTVRLWQVADGTLLYTFAGHNWHIRDVAFAPDGATLVVRQLNDVVQIWRVRDGVLLGHMPIADWTWGNARLMPGQTRISPDQTLEAILDWGGAVRLRRR